MKQHIEIQEGKVIAQPAMPSSTTAKENPPSDSTSDDARIRELEEQVSDLTAERDDLSKEVDDLHEQKDSGDLEEAINNVLDLVERPVGTIKAMLPQTSASERALMALYLAVSRNP